jgi:Sec-independent protein translocase protein TatA
MRRRPFLLALASSVLGGCASILPGRGEATRVLGVIEYGQSNSEGQAMRSAGVLQADYPAGLRMPRTLSDNVWMGQATVGGRSFEADAVTGLAPLRGAMGSATHGTTAGEGMVLRLAHSSMAGAEIVLFNAAEGGQKIRNLARDAGPRFHGFRNLMRTAEAVNAALQSEGKQYVVPVVIMAQGESDAGEARLGELQEQVRAEIESGIRAITGQREPVWLLSSQPSSFDSHSEGVRSMLGQHVRSRKEGGAYFCLGPTYNFPFAHDFLHHSSEGHAMRGELYAAAFESLQRHGRWDVLRVVAARVAGPDQILLTLSEAAEVEHLAHGLPLPGLGISLDGGEPAAVRVEGDTIRITTSGPAAAVGAVRLGLDGHGGKRSSETIPRTSIRSATEYGRYRNGTPIRKWLCHQEIAPER